MTTNEDSDQFAKLPGESSEDYVTRMQSTLLPDWPAEALREWLWKHSGSTRRYRALGYPSFRFAREQWTTEQVPDEAAISGHSVGMGIINLDDSIARSTKAAAWLPDYMTEHGTWPTPIILLRTDAEALKVDGSLNDPWHLLEGHRRFSIFNVMRQRGMRLASTHDVFVVDRASLR